VFYATFNNISAISWRSVLLVEIPGDPDKTTNILQVTDKHYHIMLYTSPLSGFEITTSVVIGTDCIGTIRSRPLNIDVYMTSPIALYNINYYIVISKNDKLFNFFYKYIPSLICFVRINFSEQPCIKGLRCEIRWEVHFQQNISTIVYLSRIW
jgi:hypothetical protein